MKSTLSVLILAFLAVINHSAESAFAQSDPTFSCVKITKSIAGDLAANALFARLRSAGVKGDLMGATLLKMMQRHSASQGGSALIALQFQKETQQSKRSAGVKPLDVIFISSRSNVNGNDEYEYRLADDLKGPNGEVVISSKEVLVYFGIKSNGHKYLRFHGSEEKYPLTNAPDGAGLEFSY